MAISTRTILTGSNTTTSVTGQGRVVIIIKDMEKEVTIEMPPVSVLVTLG